MRNLNNGVTATVWVDGNQIRAILDTPLSGFIRDQPIWFGRVDGVENTLIKTPTEPQDGDRVLVQATTTSKVSPLAITHLL